MRQHYHKKRLMPRTWVISTCAYFSIASSWLIGPEGASASPSMPLAVSAPGAGAPAAPGLAERGPAPPCGAPPPCGPKRMMAALRWARKRLLSVPGESCVQEEPREGGMKEEATSKSFSLLGARATRRSEAAASVSIVRLCLRSAPAATVAAPVASDAAPIADANLPGCCVWHFRRPRKGV